MKNQQSAEKIRQVARTLDNAIESKSAEGILSSFADDCEIEILRQQLVGKEGVKRWVDWLYKNFRQIKFQPITTMVRGNLLFEEFIVRARLHSGIEIKSKQAEVMLFANDKIKSLRLYFDRLDFAELAAKGPVSKTLVSQIVKKSLKGLT